jgi:hypothetical protein
LRKLWEQIGPRAGLEERSGSFSECDDNEAPSANLQAFYCHPERSEGSLEFVRRNNPEMFRFAQHDRIGIGGRGLGASLDVGIWRLVIAL